MKTDKRSEKKAAEKKTVEKKTPEKRPRRASGRKLTGDVAKAVRAALDKKAVDVVVLDLRNTPAFTDHFVLCSGLNQRQVKAIADARRGRAPRGQGASRPHRGLRPRRLGPHGLLHLHRPYLHAADESVLFAREALGRCRANRSQGSRASRRRAVAAIAFCDVLRGQDAQKRQRGPRRASLGRAFSGHFSNQLRWHHAC